MQQQNFSLRALAKRDADDPFSKPAPSPPAAPALPPPSAEDDEAEEKTFLETFDKAFAGLSYAA
jgi:hypothetical protein